MLITDEELKARPHKHGGKILNLIYSGRYYPIKECWTLMRRASTLTEQSRKDVSTHLERVNI
jgi:hypothetical protein